MITCKLHLGDVTESGVSYKTVDLTLPESFTPEAVNDALIKANVNPVDIKTQATLDVHGASAQDVVGLVSFFHGASGRWIRLRIDGADLDSRKLSSAFPRPNKRIAADLAYLFVADAATIARGVQRVFDARRLYITLPQDPAQAAGYFLALSGLRTSKDRARLPFLVSGSIEEEPERDSLGSSQPLDFRAAGAAFRSGQRLQAELHLLPAESVTVTDRQKRLIQAAEVDIEKVMHALPKSRTEDGQKWHCPRPERHTNGDRNPSMRIDNNMTRCFRCDGEWVDSLRIVVDATGLSPDQAADWILSL